MHQTVNDLKIDAVGSNDRAPALNASWIVDPDAISSTLSKRRTRAGAFLIDQTIAACAISAGYVSGVGVLSSISLVVMGAIQLFLVATRGQTIGKMILKIVIVDQFDKNPPGFVRAALIRQLPLMLINSFAPTFTLVYLVVDGLPIFSASRRCIHDRLAGTIVIDVPSAGSSGAYEA